MTRSFLDDLLNLVAEGRLSSEDAASLLVSFEADLKHKGGEEKEDVQHGDIPIAVIGMACRFPKASNLEEFWQNLKSAQDCISEIPESRWHKENFFSPGPAGHLTGYPRWGGFIEDIDKFDNDFFGIEGKDALYMDPQQRLFLEIAHETFERAGYSRKRLSKEDVGVFVGARAGVYQSFNYKNPDKAMTTGNMANFIPARVSDFFNLRGPSLAIDTACSSSLVAAHVACKSLAAGDCAMALVGGVELKISPYPYLALSIVKALSEDGRCHVFDKNANGFVPGEGVGAVLLKPLHAALRDGDIIHAVITGTASNNDGHTMGITSPNVSGQKDVLSKAYKNGQTNPETISLIEAHGTGTTIGDPIEVKALSEVFAEFTRKRGYCALGSVKSNIGHLDTAAGIAGLIKVILALKHKLLPATLHCNEPNPRFNFIDSPFYINDSLRRWQPILGTRRAAVSSFGFGGTNCHMVIEEAPAAVKNKYKPAKDKRQELFVLSARDEQGLDRLLNKYKAFISTLAEDDFPNLCFSSFVSRDAFPHRLAVCSDGLNTLRVKLSALEGHRLAKVDGDHSVFFGVSKKKFNKPVFMFSGQGEQYPGMGKDLFHSQPQFRQAILECADILSPYLDMSLVDYIFNTGAEAQKETFVTQLIIFAIDYALARMWMSWGLVPGCVIGHSIGEYPAGCIAGIFDLESGLKIVAKRGQLMQELVKKGVMAAVFTNADQVKECIGQLSGKQQEGIAIAAINGPRNIVVSGDEEAVAHLLQVLEGKGVRSQYLRVKRGFHSPLITPIQEEYRAKLAEIEFKEASIPFMSTILGRLEKTPDSGYWLQHNIKPVLFYPAIEALYESGYSMFLELGPGRTLTGLTKAVVKRDAVVVSSLDSRVNDWDSIYRSAANLFVNGANINPYFNQDGYQRLELPTSPCKRKSFWINQDFSDFFVGSNTRYHNSPLIPSQEHLLIDGCSSFSEQKALYYKKLTYDDPLFQDHIIRGTPTIAGFVWLEAVFQAASGYLKRPISGLTDVMFLTPFQLKQGQVGRVELSIERNGEEIGFTVGGKIEGDDHEWETLVKGAIRTGSLPESQDIDLDDIRSRCIETVFGETIYAHYREKAGIEHGSFFRGIQKVECAPNEVLVELGLPEVVANTTSGYNYHPGLLDSSIQGIYALALSQDKSHRVHHAFIPFYFQEILFYGPVNIPCSAHARITKDSNEITKFEVSIVDRNGRVLVQICNASSKRIPYQDMNFINGQPPTPWPELSRARERQEKSDHLKGLFFKLKWERSDFLEQSAPSPRKWLIFAENTSLHSRLLSKVSAIGQDYLVVIPAAQFGKLAEKTYSLPRHSKHGFLRLFESIANELPGIAGIIFLWPFHESAGFDAGIYNKDQDMWASSLLYLIQVLIQRKISLDLWIITSFAQTIHDKEEKINPFKAILWGMAGVINKEIPSIFCRCIDVNPLTPEFNCEEVIKEVNAQEKPEKVLYYHDRRYISKLKRLDTHELMKGEFLLKKHGVYVISGGLGAIGRQIALYLAKEVQANLVLVGLKRLPPEDQWHEYLQANDTDDEISKRIKDILEIKTSSANVVTHYVDITDLEQTKVLFARIKEKFGRVDGIVHAAGLNEDSLIINKDIQSFNRVLGPKVQGTLNLDAVFGGENLDFFIMFSSLAAVEGNISQIDYAGANAFLDGFALWRGIHRKGVSLAINWGLWKDVGMGAHNTTLKQVRRSGGAAIEIEEGIKAFHSALYGEIGQIIVNPVPPKEVSSPKKYNEREIEFAGSGCRDSLEKILVQMVAEYLGEDPVKIDKEDLTFLELGMDSENLIEMIQELEDRFEIKLYPTIFFEYQTVAELSAYLISGFSGEINRKLMAESIEKKSNQEESEIGEFPDTKKSTNNRYFDQQPHSFPQKPMESLQPINSKHIAIIGYNLRVPGANSPDEFWKNLTGGIESVTEIPKTRWNWEDFDGSEPGQLGKSYCKWGAFLQHVDQFDPLFFNISPKEALVLDPKQRLFLEVGWKCLEHAGYCGEQSNPRTGVFVGTSYNYYFDSLPPLERKSPFAATGNGLPLIPNRFSFFMNFTGPSVLVDTYCSSSLVALHIACTSLHNNECDMALVGGIHAPLTPDHYIIMSEMEVLSPTGQCRTFDDGANGYVPGEGVIAVLLKPLAQALRDNDCIYGIIIGSAVNHGGHSSNVTAPRAESQSQVIIDAVKNAGIDPETISYIEAHGTGTTLGDPVELQGLSKAFSSFTNKRSFCALGSVKANIGHLEPASGLIGLVKIILSLNSKKIPPALHFNRLNRYIDLSHTPFYINDKLSYWDSQNQIRRAGISSFGLTGTNVHVIVEEMPGSCRLPQPGKINFPLHILALSAKNLEILVKLVQHYEEYLGQQEEWSLAQVCYTANTGRKHFGSRVAFAAGHKESLLDKLRFFLMARGEDLAKSMGIFVCESKKRAPLVFAFPDHLGHQKDWQLYYEKNILFKSKLEEVDRLVRNLTNFSLVQALTGIRSDKGQTDSKQGQLVVFGIYYALAQVFIHLGVKPDFIYGRGIGRFTAAAVSGKYSLEDTIESLLNHKKIELAGNWAIPFLSPEKYTERGVVVLSFGDLPDHSSPDPVLVTFDSGQGDEWRALVNTVAALYVKGVAVNWKSFYKDCSIGKIPLPTYPLQGQYYWLQDYEASKVQPGGADPGKEFVESGETETKGRIVYYKRTWAPVDRIKVEPFISGKVWLIFGDSHESSDYLKEFLERNNQTVIMVRANEKFRCVDANHFCINPGKQEDYVRLKEMVNAQFGEIYGILHICYPVHHESWLELPEDVLEISFYSDVYPLFFITKAFLAGASRRQEIPKLFAVSLHAVGDFNNNMFLSPQAAAISAFMKTASAELGFVGRFIGFDPGTMSNRQIADKIAAEISGLRDQPAVIYRNDQSLISALAPIPAIEKGSKAILKKGGVYLVIGGSTGIGSKLALYLAGRYQARLIIVGRTPLPVQSGWDNWILDKGSNDPISRRILTLRQISEKGASCIYLDADVCSLSRMRQVIEKGRGLYGHFDGVIHSGGVIDDALIENKSFDSFRKVWRSKTLGTAVLHQVTRDEALDFFVVFSSISAVFGNPGQSDYAAANAFMDSLLITRNKVGKGKSISINWPFWQDGGMDISGVSLKHMKARGLLPLDTSRALQAFRLCLGQDLERNVIVLNQDEEIQPQALSEREEAAPARTENAKKRTEEFLGKLIKDLLFIDHDKIDLDAPFEEFGVDSLIMKKMIKALEGFIMRSVEPSSLLEYPTIRSLALHLGGPPITAETDSKKEEVFSQIPARDPGNDPPGIRVLEHKDENNRYRAHDNEGDVAVIGFSCRFPGASNIEEFWKNLKGGVDSVTEVPENRWDINRYYSADPADPNRTYCRWGGFIRDIDRFDASFFNIKEEDAAIIDPQQRIALEVAWETFEHAGYSKQKVWGTPIGIFFGARGDRYEGARKDSRVISGFITGQLTNFISARISDFFNLKGPSMTIDTACSSSLVSIHYACKSLLTGECELALAGGAELKITPNPFINLSTARALSSTGKSFVFDKRADGFVPGEGVGAVLLKPLGSAIRDRDHIYAVIKGSAVNNDGHTMGITTPNLEAQKEVIQSALQNSGIKPETISYVEAHGTGTLIGDPIEIKALTKVYERYTHRKGYCAVGSVKTNIGHLDTAAGIASFIKVVLSLTHKQIPATLHCTQPNPRFSFVDSPFYLNPTLRSWDPIQGIRRAGISSFGFGGTNCHLILEESTAVQGSQRGGSSDKYHLFTLSARSKNALAGLSSRHMQFLETNHGLNVEDICFTANAGREHFPFRRAFVCRDLSELKEKLSKDNVDFHYVQDQQPRLVFMFPGQGALFPGMVKELYQKVPSFARSLDLCGEILSQYIKQPIQSYLSGVDMKELKETSVTQPLSFAINYSLAKMWLQWGIKPWAVLGHSLGEYVAACIAEVFSLEDALKIVYTRGRLMQERCNRGSMAVLFTGPGRVENFFSSLSSTERQQVAVAAVNGPNNVVISGLAQIITGIIERAQGERIRSHMLEVSHAFHSPLIVPMLPEFSHIFDGIEIKENTIPLFSNVTGQMLEKEHLGREYWLKQVKSPVQFAEDIYQAMQQGANIFFEVGPGTTLKSMVRRLVADKDIHVCSSLDRNLDDWHSILACTAGLYVRGINFDFEEIFYNYGKRIMLPTYPFEGKSYWSFHPGDQPGPGGQEDHMKELPTGFDRYIESSPDQVILAKDFDLKRDPLLADHIVAGLPTLPGVCQWDMAFRVGESVLKNSQVCLKEVVHKAPIIVENDKSVLSQIKVKQSGTLEFEIYHRANESIAWTESCSGKMEILHSSQRKRYNIQEIRQRLSRVSIQAADIYDYFFSIGLNYGEGFRCIQEVWGNRHEVLASLKLPRKARAYSNQFSYQPSLMDGALQSIVGVMMRNQQLDGSTFIPFFAEEVRFFGLLPDQCYSHIQLLEARSKDIIKGNLEILAESGEVVVEVKQLSLRRTAPGSPGNVEMLEDEPAKLDPGLKDWLFKPGLMVKPLPGESKSKDGSLVALFMRRNTEQELLAHNLEDLNFKVIKVYAGERFLQIGGNEFTLNLQDEKDYESLFHMLPQGNITEYRFIHLWTFAGETPESINNLEQLEERLYRGIYSVFFISKNLEKIGKRRKKFFYVLSSLSRFSNNTQPFVSPEEAIISGFVKSIRLEHYDFSLSHIYVDLNQHSAGDMVKILKKEIEYGDDVVVFYKEKKRWIESLRPAGRETGEFPTISFRDKGVYLITGGLGGIGREIGKYLAEKYKARLVLINRTPMIPRSEWDSYLADHPQQDDLVKKILSIKEMENLGAEIWPFQADVGDFTQMHECISKVKSSLGSIHGVIHAAGVLKDGLFHNLDFNQFKDVLKPKVHGTWILDHVLTLEDLDFMILFSGAVTVSGNIGQSNYVAANSFLDAFARFRQYKNRRTMVLNWWFWGETGFVDHFDYLTGLTNKGVKPLTNREAIFVFEQMITSGEVQVIMKQDDALGTESGGKDSVLTRKNPDKKLPFGAVSIKEYLAEKISRMTQYKIEKQDFHKSFMDIGLDSLVLVSLADQMEQEINIRLYPTVFFEYNTIDKLGEFLFEEHREEIGKSLVQEKIPGKSPLDQMNEKRITDVLDTKEMRAIFIKEPGALQHFILGKAPIPEPGARQVRIKVIAAGINFSDVLTVMGRYPNAPADFPHILGNEVAGIVDKVGSHVKRFLPGQEVIALTRGYGGFAEYVVTGEDSAILKPSSINFSEAAAFPVIFLTAYHALYYLGRIAQGEKILIQGAAGGVGLMAVQLAMAAGAKIFAAAGSEEKLDYLRKNGVSHTINYRSLDVVSEVKRLTGNEGVDLILTSSARDEAERMMSLLAANGRFLEIGMVGLRDSKPVDLSRFFENQSFFSIDLKSLKPSLIKSHLNQMEKWLHTQKIRPIVCQSYHYRKVKDAFQYIASRKNIGKVVLSFPQKLEAKVSAQPAVKGADIAIIGMACKFPLAENYHQFWENLTKGIDAITGYPDGRRRLIGIERSGMDTYWGGFLKDIEMFDCSFFNISQAEASVMDPQQRIFLTTAWEAVEDAGYGGKGALPKETGIFVGASRQDYQNLINQETNSYQGHAVIGNTHSMLPSRLAYFLDLRGPAIAINTACSSSLVAVHVACESIRRNECKMALAGGVNLCLTPDSVQVFKGMNVLAADGRCKVFDHSADGFVSAEGVGVLVLKSLESVVKDHDYIYALIKGSALNNDGFSNGITAPNPAAQAEVIKQALENAHLSPESISYIEAHGTGTQMGDPVEIEALCKVFNESVRRSVCAIGSVKTNIGHTETAAGVASIIKTVLSIQHGVIPASIHFSRPNHKINFTRTPFYLNDRLSPWISRGFPLRAGISSFGFSGTNAHIIVEQPPAERLTAEPEETPVLFTLSARTLEELAAFAQKMKEFLEKEERFNLADIAYSMNTGKRLMKYRLALVVESREQLIRKLAEVIQALKRGQAIDTLIQKKIYVAKALFPKRLIFLFPGYNEGLAGDLSFLPREEVYSETLKSCADMLQEHAQQVNHEKTLAWQVFTRQYAAARLLQSWGISPSAVLGFGVGQYVALVVAGVLTLYDAFALLTGLKTNAAHQPAQLAVVSPHNLTIIEDVNNFKIESLSSESLSLTEIKAHLQSWQVDDFLKIGCDHPAGGILSGEGESQELAAICDLTAWAYIQGFALNWQKIYSRQKRSRVPLPTYPFQKNLCWFIEDHQSFVRDMQVTEKPCQPARQPCPEDEIPDDIIEQEMKTLRGILSRTLRIDPGEIEEDLHFGEYGMDSMLMKQAVVLLENQYKIPIQANILYEYPNLKCLTSYFAKLDGRRKYSPGLHEKRVSPLNDDNEGKDSLMGILDRFLNDELSISDAQEQILHSLKDSCKGE